MHIPYLPLRHLDACDLLACAVLDGRSVRRRVEHKLERRAASALVRRILADIPPHSEPQTETAETELLVAV